MQLETYSFIKRPASYYYEFFSDGPNGNIKKVVEFYKLDGYEEEVYNLAFGDWDEKDHHIDDLANTNNLDRDKVLATVAATVMEFMKDHPRAIILARGSTRSRTRLYQMGIARIWDQISLLFEIQGNINSTWQPFQKGVNFDAFLLKGK
jgi:hypothetical protein